MVRSRTPVGLLPLLSALLATSVTSAAPAP